MDFFENLKLKVKEETNRITLTENLEKFLEINKTCENELEKIKNSLSDYVTEVNLNENHLKELMLLINELTITVTKKCQQFNTENSKYVNEKSINTEGLQEKLELEKSELKVKYLENNNSFLTMLSVLKTINEKIIEIENIFAEAVAQEKICREKLMTREREIEEFKKQKEHEEAVRKEAEQKEIQRAKEVALEAKHRQQEIEKMKKIIEEEEKKNSEEKVEHFTKIRYDLPNSEFGENGIACFIKVLPGFMASESDIVVELIDPLNINCNFDGTDEIVSNIINIKSSLNDNDNLKFDQAFSIIMPHSMQRIQGRETIIFRYFQEQSKWVSVDTQDVAMEDSDKSGARFVESVFDELPLTLTVVNIPRIEDLQYGKRGCNWSAAADGRVNFTIPPGAVKVNLSMKITTLAFDSSLAQDIKSKSKGTNADNIYSFSPLLKIDGENRKFLKPASISLPLPQKQLAKSDSGVPLTVFGSNTDGRAKSNFVSQDNEENVLLLTMDSNKKWIESTQTEVEMDDKKDSIKFEIDKATDWIFMGIRAKVDSNIDQISKGVEIIMNHFKLRQIKIIVCHHIDDQNLIIVSPCSSSRLDKQLRMLKEDGFDDKDCQISQELEINEREILSVRLRGNIKINGDEGFIEKFMYCSQLKNKIKIRLEVVDKYAQRAKPKYEGFLTVTTSKWTKKPQPRVEGQPRKNPPPMIDIEEIVPIFDTLIDIPKVQSSTSSKILNREFHFVSKDGITEDLIKQISFKVKEDWKMLAKALDLPLNRIEEINTSTNNTKCSPEMAYEVLKLWIMHLPVSKNKEKILRKALNSIHRQDLVEEINI